MDKVFTVTLLQTDVNVVFPEFVTLLIPAIIKRIKFSLTDSVSVY